MISSKFSAQSDADILEQCVEKYNELNDALGGIQDKQDKVAFADSLYEAAQENRQRLALLITSQDAEVAKCAKYFHLNSKYQFAFAYGAAGSSKKCFQYMEEIEKDVEGYTESVFPIRYKFHGQNFVITWDNYSPTKLEYYVAYGELLQRDKKSLKAKSVLENALALVGDNTWLSYVLYDNLIKVKLSLAEYDEFIVKYGAAQLGAYYRLDESNLKTVADNKYSTYEKAISGIDEYIDRGPMSQAGYGYLITAIDKLKYFVDPAREKDESKRTKNKFTLLRWYDTAISSPHATKELIKTAYTFTRYNAPDETFAMTSWLNKLSNMQPECDEYFWLMDAHRTLGNDAIATSFQPKLSECEEKRKEEQQRLAKETAEQEARNARLYRRSTRKPLIYLGGNVFPFFTKPRDYGLALNVGGKGLVVEISYLKINEKPENYFDLSLRDVSDVPEHRWDGYFAHVNFKFPMESWNNGQARSYAGFVLAYNEREFLPFTSNVSNPENAVLFTQEFRPTSRQYLLMGNMGFMGVAGFGIDMFFGLGGAYNQFSGNTDTWNSENFVIDDAMMANRKPGYFSFSMRMGVSVGIGWAKP